MWLRVGLAVLLGARAAPEPSGQISVNAKVDLSELDPRLQLVVGKSAGPALLASIHNLCGRPDLDLFEAAWIRHLTNELSMTSGEQKVVRGVFERMREGPEERISKADNRARAVEQFCARAHLDPTVIERGIAGDFSDFKETGAGSS